MSETTPQDSAAMSPASTGSLAWISVKERLPQLHFSVICFLNGQASEMQCTRHHDRLRWYYPASGEYDDGVTHWMPLPAPPTDAK